MKRWLSVAFCLAAIYGLAYADLTLRARSAYYEGQKYLEWDRNPGLKKAHFEALLAVAEQELRRDFQAGKFTAQELQAKLMLARFETDQRLSESALKYAYTWFKTAVDLFSPPESKWAALCRQQLPRAKALWKKELEAKKIPYEDYQLE
ncbi:MAG: hypothetical protein A3J74_00910 [Elusimicrobia bacterium RIFCSPHIGHO2_02_FULL_57_9]|nr:MAG: hypothetical protein A3J74_00910 [Elusimicrobia bacterium RIFCSPHIGHO2_02_FULL_57_9]